MQPDTLTGTINPAFARRHADKLRELSDDLHRVYDNLREIARGDTPNSTGYDRLRATRVLYDRGMGKVARNQANISVPVPSQPTESEESQDQTTDTPDPQGGEPAPSAAQPTGRVAQIEQKLNDLLGPPQAPAYSTQTAGEASRPAGPGQSAGEGPKSTLPEPAEESPKPQTVIPAQSLPRTGYGAGIQRGGEPGQGPPKIGLPAPSLNTPDYVPDLVRESQYYIMEITNYGDELAEILFSIHEPDPEDTSIRDCHRITAGMMILERVIGPVAELETPLDHWHEPYLEPNWAYKHPAEIDSSVTVEEMIEADRDARQFLEGYRREAESPCEDCADDHLCEFHDPNSSLYDDPDDEDGLIMTARSMRNLKIFGDRLYFDEQGLLRLHPPNHIDDS